MELTLEKTENKNTIPEFDAKLGFGKYFTDHMFIMEYSDGKWHTARICPSSYFSMHPASMCLHYGQAIFEGMKAYRSCDDIFLFRPEQNIRRMNNSAKRLVMPEMDEDFVINAIKELVLLEKDWIPQEPGYSLYIRPTMIATEPFLGVRPSSTYTFFIIASPVGAYYASGFNPVDIFVSEKYVRSVRGSVGDAKASGNYAASLLAMKEGMDNGCSQVLWLDAIERKYLEEVGSMNIFVRFGKEVATPALSGAILPGTVRDTVITILNDWGLTLTERKISIDEVTEAIKNGEDVEIFGTGTAAIVSPVGKLVYKGDTYVVADGNTGPLSQKLFNYIVNLQTGKIEDKFNFVRKIG